MIHLYWLAGNKGHGIKALQETRDRHFFSMCGQTDLPKTQVACFADDADCPRCLALLKEKEARHVV